jgi:uncharacterized protein (TIGR02117 family)
MNKTSGFKKLVFPVVFLLGLAPFSTAGDTVHIVQQAWHTGIILKTSDVSRNDFPLIENYQHANYIDVSWGDEKYYQIAGRNILLALRAVLFPTRAVIRLVSFNEKISTRYDAERQIQIVLDSTEFSNLCRFVSQSFIRDVKGDIVPSTVYRQSKVFFLARRKYHLFRTCNTWVALAFKNAGFDVSSFLVITAGQLFNRLEKIPNSTLAKSED